MDKNFDVETEDYWTRIVATAEQILIKNIKVDNFAGALKASQEFWDYIQAIEKVAKQPQGDNE